MSETAIAYLTSLPPEGIAWLTPAKAQTVGITYDAIDEDGPDPASEAGKTFPHDPMGTVTAFYSALAQPMVKPPQRWSFRKSVAKAPSTKRRSTPSSARCRSPSNSQARRCGAIMTSGFRANTSPNDGRRCQGRADVQTTYAFGKTSVSRIKALDGC
ncbi:hypothetical protein AB9F46_23700 [Rhizobium leguminosarum]|uniref:hypothetical protein n=1 Tax=Rhizobium leguminosarum TaxID=384 RepID=UPI003F9DFF5E